MNKRKMFCIELFVVLLGVFWIYVGVPLVIDNTISLTVFLVLSGILLYKLYELIFTENKNDGEN
jgi:hypothetical protein